MFNALKRFRLKKTFSLTLSLIMLVNLLLTLPLAQTTYADQPPPWPTNAPGPVQKVHPVSTPVPPPTPQKLANSPFVDPHLPSLALSVAVTPTEIAVGDTVTVTLSVTNEALDPAKNLAVTLPLPQGTIAVNTTNLVSNSWKWTQPILAGGSRNGNSQTIGATSVFTTNLKVTSMPSGEALLLNPTATADGLSLPVSRIGGALVLDPALLGRVATTAISTSTVSSTTSTITATLPSEVSTTYVPGTATSLFSLDKHLEIDFPAGASSSTLTIKQAKLADKLVILQSQGENVPTTNPNANGSFDAFVLEAIDQQGQSIHKFNQALTIKIHYTLQQLTALGISEPDLTLFWYDENSTVTLANGQTKQGQWVVVPTTVDEASHTATATVDHFSTFQFGDGSSPSSAFVPSLQGFQVDLFTGSSSYNYPLDLPSGSNGVKPDLNLSYDSATTDGLYGERHKLQASWVGKGWSLDTGAVSLNKTQDGRNYFTLVLNGKSFDVVQAEPLNGSNSNRNHLEDFAWRPTDETFIKVRAIYTGNRNGYRSYLWRVWAKDGTLYEFAQSSWWITTCDPANGNVGSNEQYNWQLTTATDTHSNIIHYNYNTLTGPTPVTICGTTTTVPPVDLDVWPTSITWGGVNGSNDRYQVLFGTSSRQDATDYDSSSGLSGGSPHQSQALNTITVTVNTSSPYNSSSWQTVRSYNLTHDFSLVSDSILDDNNNPQPDTHYKLTLRTISMASNDGANTLPATSFSYGTQRGTDQHFPLGGWNRLTSINNGYGGVETLYYDNIGQRTNNTAFGNNYRVITQTVTTGAGQSYNQTYNWYYSYGTPAYNTLGSNLDPNATQPYPNSAIIFKCYLDNGSNYNNYVNNCTGTLNGANDLVHPATREFRGHDTVTVIDPNNNRTVHHFYQGDVNGDANCTIAGQPGTPRTFGDACFNDLRNQEFLKGREYLTEVYNSNGEKLNTTQYTYAVQFDVSGQVGYPSSGLWQAFNFQNQMVKNTYEGSTIRFR